MCLRAGLSVLCSYSLQVGLPSAQEMRLPWQHHVVSTRSVQPLFLLFLSANWLNPPNNVFKAVFFTVWCLFSVPVARAAVNRLLESCCFPCFFFFVFCFVVFSVFPFLFSLVQFVLSAPDAILSSVTGRCVCPTSCCPFETFLLWAKCHRKQRVGDG